MNVARTAWKTMVASWTHVATTLEKAPTNTPSAAAYARTSAGLMIFLNEFTIARTKPTIAPPMANIQAFWTADSLTVPSCSSNMPPIANHATAANSTTVPSVIAVFSTTVSSVIRPGDVGACRPAPRSP